MMTRMRLRSATSAAALSALLSLGVAACGESVSGDIEEMEGGGDVGIEEDVGEDVVGGD